jgi:hypothetical protein
MVTGPYFVKEETHSLGLVLLCLVFGMMWYLCCVLRFVWLLSILYECVDLEDFWDDGERLTMQEVG